MPFGPVSYRLDELAYVRLHRAMIFHNLRWLVIALIVLATVSGIFALILGQFDFSSFLLPGILAAITAGLIFVRAPRQARAIYREQRSMQEERKLTLSEAGLAIEHSSGQLQMDWADFTKWDERAGFLLIYMSRAALLPMPMNQIGPERIAYIRSRLIETGLPTRGRGR